MEENGKQSLWLRQVATGSDVEVFAPTDARFIGLTFSHDENYIYYVLQPLTALHGTLYRMPVLGGTPVKICEQVNSPVTVSPDVKKLAFIRVEQNPYRNELVLFDTTKNNEEILFAGNSPHLLGDQGLSWSPDGRLLACIIYDIQPGQEPNLLAGVPVRKEVVKNLHPRRWGAISQIAWLNDSSGLIISAADRSTGYFYRLWFIPYPEGPPRLITPELNNYLSVSLTRDMKILLTTRSVWSSNIRVAPGGSPDQAQQVTTGTFAGIFGITWTPDGRLVYGSRDFKLYISNRDGSEQKLLSGSALGDTHPVVSPEGRYIVFRTWRGDTATMSIWRMEIDGKNPVPLTVDQWDNYPQVTPDGGWVVYESQYSGQPGIWKVSITGGEPVQLIKRLSSFPAVSPDGRWIACFTWEEFGPASQKQLIVVPFNGGDPAFTFPIANHVGDYWNGLRWTPDGRGVAYLVEKEGARNIWVQTLDDQPPRQLTHLKNNLIYDFAWSKGGEYIAYSCGQMDDDVILIRNFK
jgi:Tol biopolymer transport system component